MVDDRQVQIEAEQLLVLKKDPQVSKQAIERAFELAFPEPSGREWGSFLLRLFYSLGGALFLVGLFFFVDHFWESMNYSLRCLFFGSTTLLCAILAQRKGRKTVAGKVGMTCASVLLGGFLIVSSKVAQTGDWYLILTLWSVLILPWCIAAEFAPLWLFATTLFNVTLWPVCAEFFGPWFFREHYMDIAILALNFGLLASWELGFKQGRRWMGRRWFPPILTLIALTPITLTIAGLVGGSRFSELLSPVGLVMALTWAGLLSYFSGIRRDVSVLSLTLGSCVAVGAGALWSFLAHSNDPLSLLVFAAGLVVEVSAAIGLLRKLAPPLPVAGGDANREQTALKVWLGKLATEGLIKTEQLEGLGKAIQVQDEVALPWFVRAMTGFGAFLASVFLVLYLYVDEVVNRENGLLFGLAFCIFACVISRVRSDLLRQSGLSLSLCGQLVVLITLFLHSRTPAEIALSMLGLEFALSVYYKGAFGRFLAVNSAGICGAIWISEVAPIFCQDLYIIAIAGVALFLWYRQLDILMGPLGKAHGPVSLAMVNLLFVLLLTTLNRGSGFHEAGLLAAAGLGVLCVYFAHLMGAPERTIFGLAVAGMLCSSAPGVMAAVLVLLIGFYRRNQTLQGLAILFLLAFGSAFYYYLALGLLPKSLVLMGTGCIFLTMARGLEAPARPT